MAGCATNQSYMQILIRIGSFDVRISQKKVKKIIAIPHSSRGNPLFLDCINVTKVAPR